MTQPDLPLNRRHLLTGLAAAAALPFASRAAAAAAEIPAELDHIMVRGLTYVADPDGTALATADGRRWSPHGVISPLHFGDLSKDDSDLIQAAVDYAARLGARQPWHRSAVVDFPMQVVLAGGNVLYRVSRPIVLQPGNRHNTLRDFSILAIEGQWQTAGGQGQLGAEHYRPARSDFIFDARRRATALQFENLRLNCNDLCGGIRATARTRVINCSIRKCAGIGVLAVAGDVWVDRCSILQYDQNDPEYYDPARYSGIGVLCEDSDLRLTHSVIYWLGECIRIEGTNCTVAHCHVFNGCRGYLGRYQRQGQPDDLRKPEVNAALTAYFGRPIGDDTDLPPRSYHAGVVVTGSRSQDNSFDSVYFDNCHMEIYAHGVHFNEPKLGSKPNSSLWESPVDYWFAVYPQAAQDHPQIVIDEVTIFVESRAKTLVRFRPHPTSGHHWPAAYQDMAAQGYMLADSGWGDRVTLDVPQVHLTHAAPEGSRPAVTYAGAGPGAFLGFADIGTRRGTTFGGGSGVKPWVAGKGVKQGKRRRVGDRVYARVTPGKSKTGRTPPTQIEGVASDGRVDWLFLGFTDPEPVRFGGYHDQARILAPNGQVVIGALDDPLFRGRDSHAVSIRTGDSGITVPPSPMADDLVLETGGDGGLTIGIPDGASALVTVATPSDAQRFQIRFDDATGQIQFWVGGQIKQVI